MPGPIIGALFLTYFAGAIATGVAALLIARPDARRAAAPHEAAAVVSWTVAILVSYGGAGLTATVQAVIFRRLLGWREGARPARRSAEAHRRSRSSPTSGRSAGGIG